MIKGGPPGRPRFVQRVAIIAGGMLLASVAGAAGAAAPTEIDKLFPSDASGGDLFGRAVAISGDMVVVGSSYDDDIGTDSGSAYVFAREGADWVQQAKLNASDGARTDLFGSPVAISGNTIVVGARFHDHGALDTGGAYVFVRDGSMWTEQAELIPDDAFPVDIFGSAVAIAGDTIVVGAPRDNDAGADTGSAYVFVRDGTNWKQQTKLIASDAAAQDAFGTSVAFDGDTLVVGADGDDDAGIWTGSAYVFVRSGSTWTEQRKLVAPDPAAYDWFGGSVAVSGDTILVGSAGDDDVPFSSGSTYVYVRDGADWVQQAKLVASDAADQDYFGGNVVVSGDTALITASGDDDDGLESGSVYVFVRSNGSWHELTKLTASDATAHQGFGSAVSISGRTALIGAYADDIIGNASGSAYVFLLDGIGSLPCTMVGTAGNDVLTGTSGSDVICARGGNDIIYGRGGDDVLRGGAGADRIFGGFGFDWIFGNAGNDVLVGGAQGDTMIGGTGHDVLRGKAGDDHLEGNKGNDSLFGGKGDDSLFGGAGTDSCSGGLGDNTLKSCE